jgi:hypothetical protein
VLTQKIIILLENNKKQKYKIQKTKIQNTKNKNTKNKKILYVYIILCFPQESLKNYAHQQNYILR